MIIDGKMFAEQILMRVQTRVKTLGHAPRLGIITCAPNFETQKYLALKQKKATAVGIETRLIELPADTNTDEVLSILHELTKQTDAIVVQLPLPSVIDAEQVIAAIPTSHDTDALNPDTTTVLSPVVGAIREILALHAINPKEKEVTVLGRGRLVGSPAQRWFEKAGAHVSLVTKDTADMTYYTRYADIIVSGAGVPGLLKPEMVKEGVIILDAGTSEEGGVLRGDADPRCAEKASLFTPVPGGIGPMTIAVLLSNVVDCAEKNNI